MSKRFFQFCAVGMVQAAALAGGAPGDLAKEAANAHREPHLRWRRLHAEPEAPVERWFVPGPLGHEPGATPPEPGERAFLTRSFTLQPQAEVREWGERNGLGPRLPFSHNLSRVFPPTLFDEHPEYFPLVDGKRQRPRPGRVNWNPDLGEPAVVAHAADAARRYFEENPDAVSFALGTNDGLLYGESEATLRWVYPPRYYRERPDYSDLVFQFMNRVAEDLERDYPQKHLGALAYYWSENTPSFPLHPKVLPFLTADRSQGYDRAFRRQEERLQRAWGGLGAERLGIYDYVYGNGFLIPRLHTELLARHVRHARRAGFTDYFAEVYPNWGLDGPQPWLLAQLIQDPEQSHRRLLDEYYRRFYRAAERPMRRFFERCEEQWMRQDGASYWLKHYRNESQAAVFPPAVCAELRGLLDRAAEAAADDAMVAARVRLTSDAFAVTERFVEFDAARARLMRTVIAATAGDAAARDRLPRVRAAEAEARARFEGTYRETRSSQPLSISTHQVGDYLRSDWGPAAEWVMAGRGEPTGLELLDEPRWAGEASGASMIAGLPFRVPLPGRWEGRSEPWEGLKSDLRDDDEGGRLLRLENHKTSMIHQSVALPNIGEFAASMRMRGRIGLSSRALLRVTWYGLDQRELPGEMAVGLMEGEWRDWVRVMVTARAPDEAVYAAVSLHIRNQQRGDWLEVARPSLRLLDNDDASGDDRRE